MARVLEQHFELTKLARLKTHPRNPRIGDLDRIRNSIDANDFFGAIVAQRATGYILVGNHRFLAARSVGLLELPVLWVEVTDDQAERILLADNRLSDLGTYDDERLVELLRELQARPFGLVGTGYTDTELAAMVEEVTHSPGTDDTELPSPGRFVPNGIMRALVAAWKAAVEKRLIRSSKAVRDWLNEEGL